MVISGGDNKHSETLRIHKIRQTIYLLLLWQKDHRVTGQDQTEDHTLCGVLYIKASRRW